LLETSLVPDFYRLWPERFNSKTNGITQRRWLLAANPALADLIRGAIGEGWITDLSQLRGLEKCAGDAGFQDQFLRVKRANKERLAKIIRDSSRIKPDLESLFDIQAKRIHIYKRQLLNVLHIIHEYLSLVEDGRPPAVPRTYVFAGKSAPGYWMAKQVIKLIHNVGRVVNNDARASHWMKVAFVPDYRVSLAEKIIPAADLSEQISTAGTEASGTGNMKFALNGALTIGTMDGANIEIREEVGPENIFIFGLKANEVQALRHAYRPREYNDRDPRIRRVVDALQSNLFCRDEPDLFAWIYRMLMDGSDSYLHLADFAAYLNVQEQATRAFENPSAWARMAILNVARMGKFSSDRAIREYARDIWDISPAL